MSNHLDLAGEIFGRLTVLEFADKAKCGHKRWLCRCDCGTEIVVWGSSLKTGNTKSCGCLKREVRTTHGLHRHPLYNAWENMNARCANPNNKKYTDYGGRGISVCTEWRSDFQAFYDWAVANGWELGLELDRVNNNGNYKADNCRWATRTQQNRNTRANIMHNGKCLSQWCEELRLPYHTIFCRVNRGWPFDRALNTPIRKQGK